MPNGTFRAVNFIWYYHTFFGNFVNFFANFIQSAINLRLVLQNEGPDNPVVDSVTSIPRYRRHAPAKEYQLKSNHINSKLKPTWGRATLNTCYFVYTLQVSGDAHEKWPSQRPVWTHNSFCLLTILNLRSAENVTLRRSPKSMN